MLGRPEEQYSNEVKTWNYVRSDGKVARTPQMNTIISSLIIGKKNRRAFDQ
jgi:hypothetical protein